MRSILEVVQGAEHRKPRGGAVQGGVEWRDPPEQEGFAGHALNGLIRDPFIITRSLSAPGGLPSLLSPLHASHPQVKLVAYGRSPTQTGLNLTCPASGTAGFRLCHGTGNALSPSLDSDFPCWLPLQRAPSCSGPIYPYTSQEDLFPSGSVTFPRTSPCGPAWMMC